MSRMAKFIALAVLLLSSCFVFSQGNTVTLHFSGVPTGTCAFVMRAVNSANGHEYNCPNGSWNDVGPTAAASVVWSSNQNPATNLSLTMSTNLTTFTYGDFGATPTTAGFLVTDAATTGTDTSFNLGVDTGGSSAHNSFFAKVNGAMQLQACRVAGPTGIVVVGSVITCSALSTTPLSKFTVEDAGAGDTSARLINTNATPTGIGLEVNFTGAAGTGFNLAKFSTGCSATDSETGCTAQATLRGDGALTVNGLTVNTTLSLPTGSVTNTMLNNKNVNYNFQQMTLGTSALNYAVGAGTAQAQTVSLTPTPGSLGAGLVVAWLPLNANSGAAPTLTVNALAAKPITKCGTTAVVAGDLSTTAIAVVEYDGTEFQLQNPQVGACGSSGGSVSSVGLTVNGTSPSGIFTVTGSPVTSTGTLNFNLAGNSGGFPYFSNGTTLTSTATLTAHGVILGEGSGSAPVATAAGSTNQLFASGGASADPGYKSYSDITPTDFATGGGIAQAQTVTLSPAATALTAGLIVRWLPTANNTGAGATLAVNGLTAKTITKCGTTSVAANDLTTTAVAQAIYDGTEFQLINPQAGSCGSVGGAVLLAPSGSQTIQSASTVGAFTIEAAPSFANSTNLFVVESSALANWFSVGLDGAGNPTAQFGSGSTGFLTSGAFVSGSTNPANSGVFRLASADSIVWRNNLNTGDISFSKNTSDVFSLPQGGTTYFLVGVQASLAGGTNFLCGDGTNYGITETCGTPALTVSSLTSSTANPATAGIIRLASGDAIEWRNNANSANLVFSKNTSDVFSLPQAGTTYNLTGTTTNLGTTAGVPVCSDGSNYGLTITCADFPDVKIIPAANCNNGTAGPGWSIPTSSAPTVSCIAGTNNLGGMLSFSDSQAAQFEFELPGDWDTTNQPYISIFFNSGSNTTGTVIFNAAVACTKSDGSVTSDPAFNTADALTTKTMAAATRMWSTNVQLTQVTGANSCVAGGTMIVKITRATDTAASAVGVTKAVITTPRIPKIQAD